MEMDTIYALSRISDRAMVDGTDGTDTSDEMWSMSVEFGFRTYPFILNFFGGSKG
jgi:hypothetical protein